MKKKKDRLLWGAGRRLLKTACAGILAGAMVALAAMPAFAEGGAIDFIDLQEIEAGDDTFGLNLVYKYKSGNVEDKSTVLSEDVSSQMGLRVYKLADLSRNSDAENFHYVYRKGVPKAGDYASDEYADDLVAALRDDDTVIPALVSEYDQMYTDGKLDNVSYQSGTLNKEVSLDGKGLDACGVYYVHVEYPQGKSEFSIAGRRYQIQSVIVTVPNAAYDEATDTGHQTDEGSHHVITVYPKPALASVKSSDPPPGGGNPPPGGGNPPPGRVPPSEGSVLGASRDEIPPQVLGANRLPQTGQLWWPVPVLCIMGFALIFSGVHRRKAAEAVR